MVKSSEENFEEGKTVEEYTDSALVDELNGLQIEPEPFPSGQHMEQVAEVIQKPVKKKEEEKKIVAPVASPKQEVPQVKTPVVVSVPIVEPLQNAVYVAPVEEELPLPPPPPEFENASSSHPSFDGVIKNVLLAKRQAIFDRAEKDAAQVETNLYTNLFNAFDAIANGAPLVTSQQSQPIAQPQVLQPVPVPVQVQPQVIEKIVVDNSLAISGMKQEIQRIDAVILDPKSSDDLKSLHLAKVILQKQISKLDGTYIESSDDASTSQFQVKTSKPAAVKSKKGFNLKMGIAAFGGSVFAGILVWLSLSLMHII